MQQREERHEQEQQPRSRSLHPYRDDTNHRDDTAVRSRDTHAPRVELYARSTPREGTRGHQSARAARGAVGLRPTQ